MLHLPQLLCCICNIIVYKHLNLVYNNDELGGINMSVNLSEDLKKVKVLFDYTDEELASDLRINRSTLSRWITKKNYPNNISLNKIYSYIYSKGIKLNLIDEELYKSKETKNNLILFHGSKSGIEGNLTVEKGNEKKDFGKGFYLGESVKQAVSFVSNYPNSVLYIVEVKNIDKLKIKYFDVSKEWMIIVAYYRGKINEYLNSSYLKELLESIKGVDMIVAPIADNSMYSIINEFIEGGITDEQCINALSANRLGKQVVILNDRTLNNNVKIIKESFLCIEEKNQYEEEKENDRNVGKAKMILAKRKYAGIGKYIEEILV